MTPEDHGQATWSERVNAAWDAWNHWAWLPGRFRMDRALKEAGMRDLVVAAEQHKATVTALSAIAELGQTDGPAAPLLVQCGDIAAQALHDLSRDGGR